MSFRRDISSERKMWENHSGLNQRVKECNNRNSQRKHDSNEKKKIVIFCGWQRKLNSKEIKHADLLKRKKKRPFFGYIDLKV